jgi:hypothetical protein
MAGNRLWPDVDATQEDGKKTTPNVSSKAKVLTFWQPPGPLPLPIVGNTFSLPENKPWIYFEQLSKSFNSPVITFWIGTKRLKCFIEESLR